MKKERERIRELEELLEAVTEAIGQACSRDARLRSLLGTLRQNGLELRLHVQLRQARGNSSGFALELRHPWSRTWSQEDVETLHALGIALEEPSEGLRPSEPNDHFPY
ncbi:MAG: hypothetical protein ACUVRE_01565 [Thermoanaerobaculaceae bacterium]